MFRRFNMGRPIIAIGPLLVFSLSVGVWYMFSNVIMSPQRRFLVPEPHAVLDTAFLDPVARGQLLDGLWVTTEVALTGLAAAIVIGSVVAIIMSLADWLEYSLYPYAVLLQVVPILAIVPLLGILFGFNFKSRVIVSTMLCLFPIITNTLFGLKSADSGMHDLFRMHGASIFVRYVKLQIPAGLPAIFTGYRIAAGASIIGAIVGDFFFRQGEPGLGILLDRYRSQLRLRELYGAIIYAALLGIVVFFATGFIGQRVCGRWSSSQRE